MAKITRIDWKRYRKVRRFVTRTFLHFLFWDVLLAYPAFARFRRPAVERWRLIARRYRSLAGEMGGVLIKLGQFLSVRVDLLPPEVLQELAGLQDEVPPETFADIVCQIETDFGRPLDQIFSRVDPRPVGSASLAQVHRARLPTGEEVVVKVLRPGIELLVETDLAAASLATRLLQVFRQVRRRVDLRRLSEEFRRTTEGELDLAAEGKNAERFATDFAADPRVYVPKVYWAYSAHHTMTMEDVGFLKIGDLAGLERAGIDRRELARVLYRVYMQQIFVYNFVHADPHPGNLFVRPLPGPGEPPETVFGPGDPVPYLAERPFQVVFVDFGMVAVIPQRLRGALREYVIALGTQDAARLVHAYASAGVLLPGADLTRLEEMHRTLFERFWGVRIGRMRDVAFSEAGFFLREYRDLLYDAPFQIQVDLLFATRAVGLLSGLATTLDPEFDPWAETLPFAERLAKEELRDWRAWAKEGFQQLRRLTALPGRLEGFLTRVERGEIAIQTALAPETKRAIKQLERSAHRLTWSVLAAAALIGAVLLHIDVPKERWDLGLALLAVGAFLWGTVTKR
jgi:predicted unusual protein kinase regulating ubiquinone biosynthesis (AarF/ABC1/UbiB family)